DDNGSANVIVPPPRARLCCDHRRGSATTAVVGSRSDEDGSLSDPDTGLADALAPFRVLTPAAASKLRWAQAEGLDAEIGQPGGKSWHGPNTRDFRRQLGDDRVRRCRRQHGSEPVLGAVARKASFAEGGDLRQTGQSL